MFNHGLILTLFVLFNNCNGWTDIGRYFKICNRNSWDTNECLLNAIRDGVRSMINGIPDLGLPPVDPHHQKEIRVSYNNSQINATMVMSDILTMGLKGAILKKARLQADSDNFHLEVDLFSPRTSITGFYHGFGAFSSLRVNASGEFNCTMHELDFTWKIDGKSELINNVTYMRIDNFYMKPIVGRMKSYFTTDDPKNKNFIQFVNKYGNENWKWLYEELLPYAQVSWKSIGTRFINRIFLKIPYNQLFPTNYVNNSKNLV